MMRNIRILFYFSFQIDALRAPVALAQRHYRTHTLQVRTLAFGLKNGNYVTFFDSKITRDNAPEGRPLRLRNVYRTHTLRFRTFAFGLKM